MKKQLDSVKHFHETYKLSYNINPVANLGSNKNKLRFDLMLKKIMNTSMLQIIMILLRLQML